MSKDAAALKRRVRELRSSRQQEQGDQGSRSGRVVTLRLKDEPAPPVFDKAGEWTGEVASWFIETGVEQGLGLDPMPGHILRETEKAVLFRQDEDSREVWIPKSVIAEVEG